MTEPIQTLQHQGTVLAEDVVIQGQQISALVMLGTFLKATDQGVQLQLTANMPQRPAVFVNSLLLKEVLLAEFNRLGEALTAAGVDLDSLMKAEHQRFEQLYKQQSN